MLAKLTSIRYYQSVIHMRPSMCVIEYALGCFKHGFLILTKFGPIFSSCGFAFFALCSRILMPNLILVGSKKLVVYAMSWSNFMLLNCIFSSHSYFLLPFHILHDINQRSTFALSSLTSRFFKSQIFPSLAFHILLCILINWNQMDYFFRSTRITTVCFCNWLNCIFNFIFLVSVNCSAIFFV